MERRRLANGVEVSRIILGCGNFGGIGSAPEFFGQGESDEEAFAIMDAAWELGITTFDTADAYGGGRSESAIGKWITSRELRPEITTKTFNPMEVGADRGLKRQRITRQLESSLDRLGVHSVDVYLAHDFDPETPLPETLSTFEGLQELGLIKSWGVSNFGASQLRSVFELALPAVVQNAYSLLQHGEEDEVLELCKHFDVSYTPHSPLGGGLLTGKYRHGDTPAAGSRLATRPEPYAHLLREETFAKIARFVEFATAKGLTPPTLAIAWLLAQPAVTAVVVGPRRAEHLEPAVAALGCELSPADLDEVARIF